MLSKVKKNSSKGLINPIAKPTKVAYISEKIGHMNNLKLLYLKEILCWTWKISILKIHGFHWMCDVFSTQTNNSLGVWHYTGTLTPRWRGEGVGDEDWDFLVPQTWNLCQVCVIVWMKSRNDLHRPHVITNLTCLRDLDIWFLFECYCFMETNDFPNFVVRILDRCQYENYAEMVTFVCFG